MDVGEGEGKGGGREGKGGGEGKGEGEGREGEGEGEGEGEEPTTSGMFVGVGSSVGGDSFGWDGTTIDGCGKDGSSTMLIFS